MTTAKKEPAGQAHWYSDYPTNLLLNLRLMNDEDPTWHKNRFEPGQRLPTRPVQELADVACRFFGEEWFKRKRTWRKLADFLTQKVDRSYYGDPPDIDAVPCRDAIALLKGGPARRGRRPRFDAKADQAKVNAWQRARDDGIQKKDYARGNERRELARAQARIRAKKHRELAKKMACQAKN
jgi:hypothetical protein